MQPLRPAAKQPKGRAPGVPVTLDYYTINAPRGEEPPKAAALQTPAPRAQVQPPCPAGDAPGRHPPGVPLTKDYYTFIAPSTERRR